MPYYAYQGHDAADALQQGTVEADSLADALEQLQLRGLSVHSLALADPVAVVTANQQQQFYDRLDVVLSNRHEWVSALKSAVQELPTGRVRREIERLIQRLNQDMSAEEFLQDPAALTLFPWMVSTSTAGATSTQSADRVSELLSPPIELASPQRMWIYPLVLAVLVGSLLVGFAHFLIPIFREMYDEFGITLPPPTRLTFWVADQLTGYLVRTLIIVAVVIAVIVPGVRWWRRRALADRLLGRWVAGSSSNLRSMATFTRVLADLLALGAPLADALRMAGRASRHYGYQRAADELAEQALELGKLSADATSRALPPSVVHALRVTSAGLPNIPLLHELAQIYAERTGSRRDWLNTIFPAVGVVVIGIGVGFVLIALFLPLVSLVTSLA